MYNGHVALQLTYTHMQICVNAKKRKSGSSNKIKTTHTHTHTHTHTTIPPPKPPETGGTSRWRSVGGANINEASRSMDHAHRCVLECVSCRPPSWPEPAPPPPPLGQPRAESAPPPTPMHLYLSSSIIFACKTAQAETLSSTKARLRLLKLRPALRRKFGVNRGDSLEKQTLDERRCRRGTHALLAFGAPSPTHAGQKHCAM